MSIENFSITRGKGAQISTVSHSYRNSLKDKTNTPIQNHGHSLFNSLNRKSIEKDKYPGSKGYQVLQADKHITVKEANNHFSKNLGLIQKIFYEGLKKFEPHNASASSNICI